MEPRVATEFLGAPLEIDGRFQPVRCQQPAPGNVAATLAATATAAPADNGNSGVAPAANDSNLAPIRAFFPTCISMDRQPIEIKLMNSRALIHRYFTRLPPWA